MSTPNDTTTILLPLTKGHVAIIDAVDMALSQHKWTASENGSRVYAYRRPSDGAGGYLKSQSLHRCVLENMLGRPLQIGELVDHIDGNGLNNRRSNIRLADKSLNGINRPKPKNNKSGYKGVSWNVGMKKWRAAIVLNKKTIVIGYYADKNEAALAYNAAAIDLYGEFAFLNCIQEG